MQNHPGSWYLPWPVALQKMLAMPAAFQHPGAATTVPVTSYGPSVPPNGGSMGCQMMSPNQRQQHPQSSVAAMQAQVLPHSYQQPALHQTAGAQVHVGAYNCSNSSAAAVSALHHVNAAAHPALLNSHLQSPQLQSHHEQTLHPVAAAAAAAMFTPLSLRSFLATAGNPLAGIATQQSISPCGTAVQQSNPTAAAQHVSCVPGTVSSQHQQLSAAAMNLNVGAVAMRQPATPNGLNANSALVMPVKKLISSCDKDKLKLTIPEKRKAEDSEQVKDLKKAKLETKALKAKRPGFTDERYHETSYYIENGLRKVYPYYFTFTTFTKGRWVGEKILDVFAREFRAHPAEEYERCIRAGTLTVNYEKVPIDYRLKHNDLLANIVHRHEVPVTSQPITIVHMDDDIVVVNKPASIPTSNRADWDKYTTSKFATCFAHLPDYLSHIVHPCGRYRHNTVVFILAKEYNLKNLRTIHRLDRLTSGLLLFGRSPKKARQMEHQIRNRQVQKEYICRVEGEFPEGIIECKEPIEVVSYKIGVCKVSPKGKDCTTTFQKVAHNGKTSVVLCKPLTGRMHQIRVHLQYLGYPVVNDPLYNHDVFGPLKGRGGDIGGKTDDELVRDLINIHNAENWLGIDGDSDMLLFKTIAEPKGVNVLSEDESETVSREPSPCSDSPQPGATTPVDSLNEKISHVPMESTKQREDMSAGVETESIFLSRNDGFVGLNPTILSPHFKVTVATQTGHESPDMAFNAEKMTADKHCYECKVRYRDPKPKDLVMYLHAWKYKGPGWEYETDLPNWASTEWMEPEYD